MLAPGTGSGLRLSHLLGRPWTPPVALAVLPIFFFHRLTFLGEVLYWGTPLLQFYPWRAFAVQEIMSGRVPLWNPHVGLGAPLAANLQSAVFYPLNLVYLAMPVEHAMSASVVLHVALAGLFLYAYLRQVAVSRGGAFMGGLTFMFSGYVIARAGFLSMTSVVAWLPALFLCIEGLCKATNDPRRFRLWSAGLATTTGMLLLAGHVQLAYYCLLAAGAYFLIRSRQCLPRLAVPTLLSLLLGSAVAAVQLLPTWELSRLSERAGGVPYAIASSFSLWPGQLLGILYPTLFGSQAAGDWIGPGPFWEGVLYVGILSLLLALYGGRFAPRSYGLFFAALAFAGLFLALGRYNPLFRLFFDYFPGMSSFQAPARFGLWFTFAAAVLAGYGWDAVITRRFSGWDMARAATLVGMGSLVAAVAALPLLGDNPAPRGAAAGGLLLLTSGLLLRLLNRGSVPWRGAAVALAFADLFVVGSTLNPSTGAELYRDFYPDQPLEKTALHKNQVGVERIYTPEATYQSLQASYFGFRNFGPRDAEALFALRATSMPDLSTTQGLYEVYNYDPLRLERPLLVMRAAEKQGDKSPLWMMLGVRYVLLPPTGVQADGRLVEASDSFAAPLPRAYVAHKVTKVESKAAALDAISAASIQPLTEAVVETTGKLRDTGGGAIERATIAEYTPQRVTVDLPPGSSGGLLVLSDAYYPGWFAEVDGAPAEILPTNVALRGVEVPAGAQRVVFRYDPPMFKLGAAITGVAGILLAALTVWGLRTRREVQA